MDDTRLEQKIDQIVEKIGTISITLVAQHVTLKEHIKRTEILEAQMEPIKKHVAMVHGALKLIGVVSVLISIIAGIFQVMGIKL